eukprot:TRINITY_DN3473_c0_g2_i1.p1 TRINITY_DN3473_c0_g2~~TRINITY_DN3473_c0_g2_i1.p1  ORF type:complete len:203 (+),score=45.62 TRINITY_DN3473_c0_g2_i1:87-695(+)
MSEIKEIKNDTLTTTKWLKFRQLHYLDHCGKERVWDYVERSTRTNEVDGVDILAIIRTKNKPSEVLLVAQYRPPIKGYSLEFPAGLVDKGETPQQAALRELKEETGYIADGIKESSPVLSLEPGLTNANMRLVHLEIDGDKEENKNPVQCVEETENIDIVRVPYDNLFESLLSVASLHKYTIDAKLYTFALGLEFGKKGPLN